ncbi:MAG TPA: hypothetical protein VK801_16405 [Caulobacteraceae bacterium]|nr:hypothetical protein [Caulobacteraceae bacterium]
MNGKRRVIAWAWLLLAGVVLLGACSRTAPADPNSVAIQKRFGRAQLTWLTHRVVGGQAVVCGYAGPPRNAQVFIARGGAVFTPTDVAAGQFDKWEDELCGPDWIKPFSG